MKITRMRGGEGGGGDRGYKGKGKNFGEKQGKRGPVGLFIFIFGIGGGSGGVGATQSL